MNHQSNHSLRDVSLYFLNDSGITLLLLTIHIRESESYCLFLLRCKQKCEIKSWNELLILVKMDQ